MPKAGIGCRADRRQSRLGPASSVASLLKDGRPRDGPKNIVSTAVSNHSPGTMSFTAPKSAEKSLSSLAHAAELIDRFEFPYNKVDGAYIPFLVKYERKCPSLSFQRYISKGHY